MSVCVGIDGGQTALRLAIAGTATQSEGPGFSYDNDDPYGAMVDAIRVAWEPLRGDASVDVVAAGVTGVPADAAMRQEVAAEIRSVFDAREVRLCTDAVSAHAGALPDGHGVVVAAGTGVIALAVDATTGTSRRVDGWGHLFGDGGSAFAVGRAGISAALSAFDGRGNPTSLTDQVQDHFGAIELVAQTLYRSPTRVAEIADFAPSVVTAARQGDTLATWIVQDAAAAVAHTVATAVGFVTGDDVPVAVTGRWLTTPGMDAAFAETLESVQRASVVPPAGDSLAGACRIAELDDLGVYAGLVHRVTR